MVSAMSVAYKSLDGKWHMGLLLIVYMFIASLILKEFESIPVETNDSTRGIKRKVTAS